MVQRLARDSLKDPMEVERGETTDFGQPGQRKFSVQMLSNIVEHAVNALVMVMVAAHRSGPHYIQAGLERARPIPKADRVFPTRPAAPVILDEDWQASRRQNRDGATNRGSR
jgi:hypothetical protein